MYLLAFESSCDDTSVALLRNEELISMHTHTQSEHIATMGVVPEVAARLHADNIFELITLVLHDGKITLDEIDVFAATSEPWLVPSLLIGKTVTKTLALSHKKPLIWVNHIEGHVFSILLERKVEEIQFPIIVLSASGGHNDLFLWKSLFEIEKIGNTVDDSAGESMDKVGRSLWLPFPAGRYIDELAQKYNPEIHTHIPTFPLVLPEKSLNFSFSGLKSAALREIMFREKDHGKLTANRPHRDILRLSNNHNQDSLWETYWGTKKDSCKKYSTRGVSQRKFCSPKNHEKIFRRE
jgi:N6-L-threonylcarbamoyladenine synthase